MSVSGKVFLLGGEPKKKLAMLSPRAWLELNFAETLVSDVEDRLDVASQKLGAQLDG